MVTSACRTQRNGKPGEEQDISPCRCLISMSSGGCASAWRGSSPAASKARPHGSPAVRGIRQPRLGVRACKDEWTWRRFTPVTGVYRCRPGDAVAAKRKVIESVLPSDLNLLL